MSKSLLGLASVLFVLLWPGATRAQVVPEDALRAGYERLHQGNAEGAYEHFRSLAQRAPDDLGALFGLIVAVNARMREGAAVQPEFETRLEQFILKAQARHDKNRQDREALMYLARAYTERAGYKMNHDKGIWGAARDAAKSKNFSEEYSRLDKAADADYAIGLYNYFVAIAPSFIKVLRVLLFLPSGDRALGLKQLERAAREGKLWAPEAQGLLIEIYSRYEGRPDDALRVALELQKRYPDNANTQMLLAGVYASPALEEYERGAQQFASVIERAGAGNAAYPARHKYRALLGLSNVRRQQWRLEEAVAALSPTVAAGVADPDWVLPQFLFSRGNLRSLLNDPQAAEDIRRVLAEPKWKSRWHAAAERQVKRIEERQRSGEAAVFAALIPGNRLVVERRWEEARQAYDGVRRQHPDDPQVRFRLAYLDFARAELDPAAAGFGQIADSRTRMPDWLKAGSLLYLARIADLRNQRDQALKLYKRVVNDYENDSSAQAARLGLLTAYRRRPAGAAPASAAAP